MPDAAAAEPGRATFGAEPQKLLPVLFIILNILVLWVVYMLFHSLPMMSHSESQTQGIIECIVFNALALMIVVCYVRCIVTNPGGIPDKSSGVYEWEYQQQSGSRGMLGALMKSVPALGLQETKKSGDRRHCKWCAKYKPDRCHHCRVCRQCVLKMDHHCPWIYNCVGFRNHKYFFLLLLYTAIITNVIVWTMLEDVQSSLDKNTPFSTMFMLIFGETLAAFLALIVTVFFLFHCWLMVRAMTTIEFCEKSMKRTGYDTSVYNRGLYGNLTAVLGDNPLLWWFPGDPPSGDGIHFLDDESAPIVRGVRGEPLKVRGKEMEANRGIRRGFKSRRALHAGTGECAGTEYGDSGPPSALCSGASLQAPSEQDDEKPLFDASWTSV